MLKYLAKISLDIFPSVLATIIGAYIVNHYINAKPAPAAPAVAVAPAEAKKDTKPADVANLPSPGVKAKGIPEKAMKSAEIKPTETRAAEIKPTETKAAESRSNEDKSAETKPAETVPAEAVVNSHVHQPAPREKAVAKVTTPQAAPVVENSPAPATQAQDANDLARAAIERLRKSQEASRSQEKTPQETARSPEAPRVQEAPQVVTAVPTAVRPLPPPITVSTPGAETYGASPESTASVGNDDPNRPTPPADIPVPIIAPPLDLRADAAAPMPRAKTNVAEEMLSGVKSMFHAVLPKPISQD
jgi:hypothetical protein